MDRRQSLEQALSLTLLNLNFIAVRDRDPRQYGTEELLYMTEVDTLAMIGDHKDCSAVDIAQLWHISKSAVSKTLHKLEKHGLILRREHPEDGRRTILSLSPKGEIVYKFHKQLDKTTNRYMMKSIESCTDEELEAYIKISKLFHGAMIRKLGPSQGWKKLSPLQQ
jgi:DNA-binding MarR family transcriptional regulator